MQAFVLGSNEFFATQGRNSNNGFLPALYQIVLHRQIDSAGAQSWGQVLQSGQLSRTAVAALFLGSLESDRLKVQTLYRHLLHREADPSGLNAFIQVFQSGSSTEQVTAFFMSSQEYFSEV